MTDTSLAQRLEQCVLGESPEEIELGTRHDHELAVAALARQARRSLHLYTRDLEPPVYDTTGFVGAVRQLALGSRHARVEVLLRDSSRVVADGHRMVELARRLSSFIELRRPHSDYDNYNEAFLIADEAAVIHRIAADRYQGTVRFHAPRVARELLGFFREVWQRSAADTQLRRIHL